MASLCADMGKSAGQEALKHEFAITTFLNIDGKVAQIGTVLLCAPANDASSTQQLCMKN